jgi:hypothetical protein
MMTNDPPIEEAFYRQRVRPVDWAAEVRADEAREATAGLARLHTRRSLNGDVVLTWEIAHGRTLVWYAQADGGWRPARVVQQGDPRRTHWADVGAVEDLAAILREEMGIEGE